MNPFKKLVGQTAIYGIPTIVGRLLTQFLTPLYTYIYTTGEYGVVTSLYAYISFLLVLLTYGMETALFKFSQSELDKEKVYSTSLISVFCTSVLFVALAALYASPVADAIRLKGHPEYIVWFALILGTDAVTSITFARLREQNRPLRFSFIRSTNIAIFIFLNVFFIWFCGRVYKHPDSSFYPFVQKIYDPEIGVGYIFISNLIASTVTLLLLLPDMFRIRFTFDSPLWKRMMIYAIPLLIAGMAGMVNETMDRILLTYLLPENEAMSQTGIYGACYKIAIIMTVFIQTFRFAAEPFFFSHAKEKDAKKTYADIMKYFVIICSVIFLGTMMNLSWIQYFIGEPFREGLGVVPILLLANLCLGVFINQSFWYKLTGQTRYGAYLAIFGAVITLVLNFYLIPRIGYMGSAWATLVCYAAMMIASYFLGQKHYPVDYDLKRFFGYVTLSLILYVIGNMLSVQIYDRPVDGKLIGENIDFAILALKNSLLLIFVIVVFLFERKNLFHKEVREDN